MTLDSLTAEQIRAITDRALQEGRIPSPDACDEYGRPLLKLEMLAALFGLTPEQAQAEEAEFDQQVAEVAFLGPIRPVLEEGTVNSGV